MMGFPPKLQGDGFDATWMLLVPWLCVVCAMGPLGDLGQMCPKICVYTNQAQ